MFYEKDGVIKLCHEVSNLNILTSIPKEIRVAVYEYVYYIVISKSIARSNMYDNEKDAILREQLGDKKYKQATDYDDLDAVIELCKSCIYSEDQYMLEVYKTCLKNFSMTLKNLSETGEDVVKVLDQISKLKREIRQAQSEIQSKIEDGTYRPASPHLAENREFISAIWKKI